MNQTYISKKNGGWDRLMIFKDLETTRLKMPLF